MGLRVIAPDMIGYGQTDAPIIRSGEPYTPYSWKATADDMAALLSHLSIPRVILLGHDWGGVVVSRIYLHYPSIVTHIVSVCTPYFQPVSSYIPIETVVKSIPSFTYQIAFADPQTERDLGSREAISRFFRSIHRGLGEGGPALQVTKDWVESLGDWPRGKLLTEKDLEYYVEMYSRNGLHGPLNWYKTRYVNSLGDKDIQDPTINVPYLFVAATHDAALPPSLAKDQAQYIPNLTSREIKATHWVMEEAPEELLVYLKEWFEQVCFGPKSKI